MQLLMRVAAGWVLALTSLAAGASNVTGTMTVSGVFAGRGNVAYVVTLTNSGTPQADNPSNEMVVTLPASLALTAASANAGSTSINVMTRTAVWNGSIASGASVAINILATVNPTTPGNVVSAQAAVLYDANGDGANETVRLSDDPATAAIGDATSFTAVAGTVLSGTLVANGLFTGGARIGYTARFTNAGPLALNDNPSNEFIVTLPASLIAVSASAETGSPFTNFGNNSISWTGDIPAGATVTVQMVADIRPNPPGTVISSHATLLFDRNGDNTNEFTVMTDDPGTFAVNDATAFTLLRRTDLGATMAVAGDFVVGGEVVYTVVLTNSGVADLTDNPSNEFITTLPNTLNLVSVTANTGFPFANTGNNSASWSGPVALGAPITVTIRAIVDLVPPGTLIQAQGTALSDGNGDNTNESGRLSDNPATQAVGDVTGFVVTLPPKVFSNGFEG